MIIDILTIQDQLIFDAECIAHHNGKCNYKHALPIYQRLFDDYNKKFGTDYKNFFFGFSKLRMGCDDCPVVSYNIKRALEMIGLSKLNGKIAYWLQIPQELYMESDFYNFTDFIYDLENPGEIENMNWERDVYSNRDAEKQVIFPYIKKEWIFAEINPDGKSFIGNKEIPTDSKGVIQFKPFEFQLPEMVPTQFLSYYPIFPMTPPMSGIIKLVNKEENK